MAMTNGTDSGKRSVRSLGELSQNVAPPRDLWPSIASQIAMNDSPVPASSARTRLRPTGLQWAALAAVIAALAVGIWLGRSVLPAGGARSMSASNVTQPQSREQRHGNPATPGGAAGVPDNATASGPSPDANALAAEQALPASFVNDPRYTMQRAALIRGLEDQLKTLPPDTQHKVASSLATIRASIKDLQEALGRDPANALLQELLVNSYQDEMRVLTAVHEASGASGGV
jgi:hypothetical protein